VSRGKERLVLIRPMTGGLAIHTLYYADEVRSFDDVALGDPGKRRDGEMKLAQQLIAELTAESFQPDQYRDHYRDRLREVVDKKVAGEETTIAETAAPKAQIIDLMEALKQSLGRGRAPATAHAAAEAEPRRRAAGGGRSGKKKQ